MGHCTRGPRSPSAAVRLSILGLHRALAVVPRSPKFGPWPEEAAARAYRPAAGADDPIGYVRRAATRLAGSVRCCGGRRDAHRIPSQSLAGLPMVCRSTTRWSVPCSPSTSGHPGHEPPAFEARTSYEADRRRCCFRPCTPCAPPVARMPSAREPLPEPDTRVRVDLSRLPAPTRPSGPIRTAYRKTRTRSLPDLKVEG